MSPIRLLSILFAVAWITGCGGSGGTDSGVGTANLAGTWRVTTATDTPGFVGGTSVLTVNQSGTNISGSWNEDGGCIPSATWSGQVSGNTFTFNGSGQGGTFSARGTVNSPTSISGTASVATNGTFCRAGRLQVTFTGNRVN